MTRADYISKVGVVRLIVFLGVYAMELGEIIESNLRGYFAASRNNDDFCELVADACSELFGAYHAEIAETGDIWISVNGTRDTSLDPEDLYEIWNHLEG